MSIPITIIILDSLKTHGFSRVMKHNESGIPSSNKPTTLVVGYKEDVIYNIVPVMDEIIIGLSLCTIEKSLQFIGIFNHLFNTLKNLLKPYFKSDYRLLKRPVIEDLRMYFAYIPDHFIAHNYLCSAAFYEARVYACL